MNRGGVGLIPSAEFKDFGVVGLLAVLVIKELFGLVKTMIPKPKILTEADIKQMEYQKDMKTLLESSNGILNKLADNTLDIEEVVTSSNGEIKLIKENLTKLSDKSENRAEMLRDTYRMTSKNHDYLGKAKEDISTLAGLYANTKIIREQ